MNHIMNISEKMLRSMFGVSRQRLSYWRKIGLIPQNSKGSRQGYSFQDVLLIKVVVSLIGAGIQPKRIKQTLDSMRLLDQNGKGLTEKSLFVSGKEIFVFQDGKAIEPRTRQFLLFQVEDFRNKLKKIILEFNNEQLICNRYHDEEEIPSKYANIKS